MTEMINHATVHKELLHDMVTQDAFAYDQADSAVALSCRKVAKMCCFPGALLSTHQSADNTFLRAAANNLGNATPTAPFGSGRTRIPGFQAREVLC